MSDVLWVSVDVEANGPCPGLYSMTSFGAVVVEPELKRTFLIALENDGPLVDAAHQSIVKGVEVFPRVTPEFGMKRFAEWCADVSGFDNRLLFCSDNPAFDWQFINYYFHKFCGENPFGWSARRIGDLFCGAVGNRRASWKHLRDTPHTHNPLDDAKGNAEALMKIFAIMEEKRA